MEYPKCPSCPTGKDEDVVPSISQKGKWYCRHCHSFFVSARSGDAPEVPKLKTYDDSQEVLWTLEEVAAAQDRLIAGFYARLNLADRCIFAGQHIDLVGDLRPLEIYMTQWENPNKHLHELEPHT